MIDTATDAPGVALVGDGRTRVRPIAWRGAFREAAPAVVALLDERGLTLDDLAAVAIPAGPGSFTGLRVGAALAVALSRAHGIVLHAVPTLEAVAEAYAPAGAARVWAVLDARRGRWYAALCERVGDGWRAAADPADVTPEEVRSLAGETPLAGPVLAPGGAGPAPVAEAIAALVAATPSRYRVAAPAELRLVYARSGVE